MAVAVTAQSIVNVGPTRLVTATIQFDSSYPTGGETLTPSDFGLSQITAVFTDNGDGYLYEYNAPKLLCYNVDSVSALGPAKETGNTSTLATVTCQALVIGR